MSAPRWIYDAGSVPISPAAIPRRRITEMVLLAERVDVVECSHALEAAVRELRLLAAHAPPTTDVRHSPPQDGG